MRLGISQPAMSARLARLRLLFGEPLFIPSPHARCLPPPRSRRKPAAGPLLSRCMKTRR
nr:LysR family transcriptional regulator [Enterobacter mori]